MTKEFTSPSTEAKPLTSVMPTADPAYFGNPFPFAFYNLGERNQMFPATFDTLQQQMYPTAGHRWPGADYPDPKSWVDASSGIYPMSFNIPPPTMESYPVDPCPSTIPSTSVAQPSLPFDCKPLDCKNMAMDYMMGRNPMMPQHFYPISIPYQDSLNPTQHWKHPKGVNVSKTGIPPTKHRTGPGTNNVRVRTQDTYRVVYTDAQRTELELEYQTQPFITAERKAELSGRLNLTERQVKIWFQNRRAKDRREKRNKC